MRILFSGVGFSCEYDLLLLQSQVNSGPGFVPIRFSCRFVIDVVWLGLGCCIRLIRTLITVYSASFHLLLLELDIADLRPQGHPLEFEVSRTRTSLFARSFLPAQGRMKNDLPYSVFHTRKLDWFKGAVNRWLLPWVVFSFVLPWVMFSLLVGLNKQFINNTVFQLNSVLQVLIIIITIIIIIIIAVPMIYTK